MIDTNVAQLHSELRAAFSEAGVVGPNLLPIHVREEQYEHQVCTKFNGYRLVHQCFLSLLLSALQRGEQAAQTLASVPNWYTPLLAVGGNLFSRARAAEILFLYGYPMEGYTLLRDLKDRSIFMAGILNQWTTLPKIFGIDNESTNSNANDPWSRLDRMVSLRKAEQRKIKGRFSANLETSLALDIKRWDQQFDTEVHLSQLSFFLEGGDWLFGDNALPAGPNYNLFSQTMYMNRSLEVAWCLTRILPIFQPSQGAFGASWRHRWELVDKNLRVQVAALAEGRPFVDSIVRWIEMKFPFDPQWSHAGPPS